MGGGETGVHSENGGRRGSARARQGQASGVGIFDLASWRTCVEKESGRVGRV
jgi:hypothetical protein